MFCQLPCPLLIRIAICTACWKPCLASTTPRLKLHAAATQLRATHAGLPCCLLKVWHANRTGVATLQEQQLSAVLPDLVNDHWDFSVRVKLVSCCKHLGSSNDVCTSCMHAAGQYKGAKTNDTESLYPPALHWHACSPSLTRPAFKHPGSRRAGPLS